MGISFPIRFDTIDIWIKIYVNPCVVILGNNYNTNLIYDNLIPVIRSPFTVHEVTSLNNLSLRDIINSSIAIFILLKKFKKESL